MQKNYLTKYSNGKATHQGIKPTTSHLLKTNRFIKFKCPKTSCPVHALCEQKSLTHTSAEVVYYKGAKEVDVVFIHQPRATEAKVCSSDVGLGFRRLIEHIVEKELRRPIGIAHLNMTCSPKGAWQECQQVLFSLIKKLNPRLIVLVGERVTGNMLDIPMDYGTDDKPAGNHFRDIHSVPTSIEILGKVYNTLPILSPAGMYDMPTIVLCSILEDLRRALGVYVFEPMKSEAEIVELRTVEQVKQFVDYVISNVDAEAIALDTEDKNLNRAYGNKLDSVQFCWDPKKAYFLWYGHPKTPFSPSGLKQVREELRRLFSATDAKFKYWLVHNSKFDLHILLSQLGVRPVKSVICTMTFPFILEENYTDSPYGGFGLKHLAKKYGFHGFDNAEVLNARKAGKLRDIPDSEFVKYATDDVVATVQLYYVLKEIAKGQNFLDESMRLMTFFFSRVYALLVEMEHNGIYIDQAKLRELSGPFSPINIEMNDISVARLRASEAAQKANALLVRDTTTDAPLFGDPWIFDIDKVKHKQALFFGVQGLKPVSRNKKDVPVTIGGKVIDVGKMDKKFQTKYAPTIPEVQWLVDYQQLKKLKTSYIKSINKFLDPEMGYEDYYTDQMLRPEFSLMAKTGRARASKPNSQQIPKGNTDVRKEVRSLYCTPPGWAIISLDYMAVEVRCWGILSEDQEMIKMFKQAKSYRDSWRKTNDPKWLRMAELYGDIHVVNASVLFDVKPEDVTKAMRNAVKALTFGTIYGMGLTTMAAQMGCDINEAKRRRDKAFSKFKQAGQWLLDIEREATTNYYVCSPLRRRRRLWELIFDENFLECAGVEDKVKDNMRVHCARAKRQGRNSPIQGFASDITFLSASILFQNVILKENKNWKFFNAVHDAIYLRVPIDEIKDCVAACERIFTHEVADLVEREFNYKLPLPLEAEFEIGTHGGNLKKWNFSEQQLDEIIEEIREMDAKKSIQVNQAVEKTYNLDSLLEEEF